MVDMPTTGAIAGLVTRQAATVIAGSLITHGVGTSSQTEAIAGAIALLLSLVWSWWQKTGQQKLLGQVAKLKSSVPEHVSDAKAAEIATVAVTKGIPVDLAGKSVGLLIAFIAISALFSGDVSAQQRKFPQIIDGGQRTDATDNVQAGSAKGVAKIGGVIANIKQFTIDDLTAAAADADAQNPPDPAGDCWRILIPAVQAQTSPLPSGLGLAQAIQKARDLQRQLKRGVSDDIKAKCAIVLWDAEAALLKLGLNLAPIPKIGLPF